MKSHASHWTRKTRRPSERKKAKSSTRFIQIPIVAGESRYAPLSYSKCKIRTFASKNKRFYTTSEKEFERFLIYNRDGILRKRYKKQHIVSGKWIVDFFFPEVRLAVEVDGSYHRLPEQQLADIEKSADCQRFDITLVRITNEEVWGDRTLLRQKLRSAWRQAMSRENRVIGRPYAVGQL